MRRFLAAVVMAVLSTAGLACMSAAQAPVAAAAAPGGPLMGYDPWYQYGVAADQAEVLQQAQLMVSDGLVAAGYDIMGLDDGWMASARTASGTLTWNTTRFPDGIPWLVTRLKSMGIKLGLYEAVGSETCNRLPGSGIDSRGGADNYALDARTFESWGASFVKVDNCTVGVTTSQLTSDFMAYCADITADGMLCSEELPISFTPGTAGYRSAVQLSSQVASMWRVAPDENPLNSASFTILGHLADDLPLSTFARSGHWNDLDMLVPGNPTAHPFNFTLADEQNQLSVWAEEASPLFISTDLSALSGEQVAALRNLMMLAVDQSGSQAALAAVDGRMESLTKTVAIGQAVLVVNTGTATATGLFSLARWKAPDPAMAYNVWTGQVTAAKGPDITYTLGAGQTALLILTP